MDNGGREALLHYLLHFDLSKVNLRQIQHAAALLEQKVNSLTPEQGWWLELLQRGRLPGDKEGVGEVPCEKVFNDYLEHARHSGARRLSIETKVGMFLRKVVPNLRTGRYTSGSGERHASTSSLASQRAGAELSKMI